MNDISEIQRLADAVAALAANLAEKLGAADRNQEIAAREMEPMTRAEPAGSYVHVMNPTCFRVFWSNA